MMLQHAVNRHIDRHDKIYDTHTHTHTHNTHDVMWNRRKVRESCICFKLLMSMNVAPLGQLCMVHAVAIRVSNRLLYCWQWSGKWYTGSVQDGNGQPASDARQVSLCIQLARLQSCSDGRLPHAKGAGWEQTCLHQVSMPHYRTYGLNHCLLFFYLITSGIVWCRLNLRCYVNKQCVFYDRLFTRL